MYEYIYYGRRNRPFTTNVIKKHRAIDIIFFLVGTIFRFFLEKLPKNDGKW